MMSRGFTTEVQTDLGTAKCDSREQFCAFDSDFL